MNGLISWQTSASGNIDVMGLKRLQTEDECVREDFISRAVDVTPVAFQHIGSVIFLPASSRDDKTPLWSTVLSDAELSRADRFAAKSERAGFIQRRAFRRYCAARALGSDTPLSELNFSATHNGQPYLPDVDDLSMSFSSSRSGFLAAWSHKISVGVDIEDRSQELDAQALADFHFTEKEHFLVQSASEVDRRNVFLQLWCLKEAALKSVGEGISLGLRAFEFQLQPEAKLMKTPVLYGSCDQFSAQLIEDTDYIGALVCRNRS